MSSALTDQHDSSTSSINNRGEATLCPSGTQALYPAGQGIWNEMCSHPSHSDNSKRLPKRRYKRRYVNQQHHKTSYNRHTFGSDYVHGASANGTAIACCGDIESEPGPTDRRNEVRPRQSYITRDGHTSALLDAINVRKTDQCGFNHSCGPDCTNSACVARPWHPMRAFKRAGKFAVGAAVGLVDALVVDPFRRESRYFTFEREQRIREQRRQAAEVIQRCARAKLLRKEIADRVARRAAIRAKARLLLLRLRFRHLKPSFQRRCDEDRLPYNHYASVLRNHNVVINPGFSSPPRRLISGHFCPSIHNSPDTRDVHCCPGCLALEKPRITFVLNNGLQANARLPEGFGCRVHSNYDVPELLCHRAEDCYECRRKVYGVYSSTPSEIVYPSCYGTKTPLLTLAVQKAFTARSALIGEEADKRKAEEAHCLETLRLMYKTLGAVAKEAGADDVLVKALTDLVTPLVQGSRERVIIGEGSNLRVLEPDVLRRARNAFANRTQVAGSCSAEDMLVIYSNTASAIARSTPGLHYDDAMAYVLQAAGDVSDAHDTALSSAYNAAQRRELRTIVLSKTTMSFTQIYNAVKRTSFARELWWAQRVPWALRAAWRIYRTPFTTDC